MDSSDQTPQRISSVPAGCRDLASAQPGEKQKGQGYPCPPTAEDLGVCTSTTGQQPCQRGACSRSPGWSERVSQCSATSRRAGSKQYFKLQHLPSGSCAGSRAGSQSKLPKVPFGPKATHTLCESKLLLGRLCPDICSLSDLCKCTLFLGTRKSQINNTTTTTTTQINTDLSPLFYRAMLGTHLSAITKPTASSPTSITGGLGSTHTLLLTFPGSTAS